MSSAFTEHDLSLLSPEEREAVTSTDITPGDEPALRNIAGEDDDETIDADGNVVAPEPKTPDAKTPDTTDASTAAAQDDPGKAAEPAKAADAAKPAPGAAVDSIYQASLPEDFDAKVQGLADSEAGAWESFEAGNLDRAALQAELRRISDERSQLTSLRTKAEISQEMAQQTSAARWQTQIDTHIKAAKTPEMGAIDYRTDTAKLEDLDTFVKTLANMPEHADKDGDWYLREAHKRVLALHGIAIGKPADPPKPVSNRGKTPLADAPQNLANVPGSDGPGDVGSEFAYLDDLDGFEIEDALKKMSPAQRQKYLAGS